MRPRNKTYLFVCVENAGRSLMAEAFAKAVGLSAESAGTLPSDAPNPVVTSLMLEKGIDISAAKPKKLTIEMIN
ncbi:Protein-tyrosine phosphatase, low molecular weight, partial [mine drainage metagenome]